ncbi:MAG: hypothetical protein WHT06_08255 [Desulfobacterales bacterium]
MKKLIAVLAVLLLAAPVMAQQWSFYGSQRMATFYINDDFGDARVAGDDSDWGLRWDFQGNSRLGARVKADQVSGLIELALRAAGGGDGGDESVNTRRAVGFWKFSDNATLKVGKDYSPVTRFISGQVFDADNGLLGNGNFYGRRPAMIGLTLGNFDIALLTNALYTTGGIAPANSDPDWNLPKLEASYLMKFGAFDLRPFGGVQYFKVDRGTSALTDDLDIWSYVIGIDSMINIGAFWIGPQVAYGQNWANAGWANGRWGATYARATLKGTDDTNDAKSLSAMLVAGLKFTDTLKFEAGVGYRNDDADVSGVDDAEAWEAYIQAVITLAKGVYLIPEIGYIDFGDDPVTGDDTGYRWYAGAKWQIDF